MIRLLSPLVRKMMVLFASKKSGVGIIQGLLDWFSSLLAFFGMQSFLLKIKVCVTNQSVNKSSSNSNISSRRKKSLGHFFCHNHLDCHKTIKTRLYPIKASQKVRLLSCKCVLLFGWGLLVKRTLEGVKYPK